PVHADHEADERLRRGKRPEDVIPLIVKGRSPDLHESRVIGAGVENNLPEPRGVESSLPRCRGRLGLGPDPLHGFVLAETPDRFLLYIQLMAEKKVSPRSSFPRFASWRGRVGERCLRRGASSPRSGPGSKLGWPSPATRGPVR